MNATLQTVWSEHESLVLERVALLEAAVAGLIAGRLSEAEREQARRAAHTLAGSLGMFGYPRSSEAALALEAAFEPAATPASRPHAAGKRLDPSRAFALCDRLATMRAEGLEPSRA